MLVFHYELVLGFTTVVKELLGINKQELRPLVESIGTALSPPVSHNSNVYGSSVKDGGQQWQ